MKISELQPRQGNVEVIGEITEIGTPKEFQKFGKSGRVATAKLADETGEVLLSLWNEQIDNFKVGDTVKIENGYVNEWQGEKQLTTGKFGKMEKVDVKIERAAKKGSWQKADTKLKSDNGNHILSDDEQTEAEALNTELGEPAPENSVTHDEETEAETLKAVREPSKDELDVETDDELGEEEIKIEEEEVT